MEMEQRLKALEYELKVLKNEIQKTLLDIQEQVLSHYYPTLRSGDPAQLDGVLRAAESARNMLSNSEPVQESKPTFTLPVVESKPFAAAPLVQAPPVFVQVDADRPVTSAEEEDLPAVRRVSLDEVPVQHREPLVEPDPGHKRAAARTGKLMEWSLDSAAHIGTARTNKILQVFGNMGLLDADVRDVLLEVAPLNRRKPPDEVPVLDVLREILKLNALLDREADIQETLALIKEADLG